MCVRGVTVSVRAENGVRVYTLCLEHLECSPGTEMRFVFGCMQKVGTALYWVVSCCPVRLSTAAQTDTKLEAARMPITVDHKTVITSSS